jgi:hypothetical protein
LVVLAFPAYGEEAGGAKRPNRSAE